MLAKVHLAEMLKQNPDFKSGNFGTALSKSLLQIDDYMRTPQGKKELKDISSKLHKSPSMYDSKDPNSEIAFEVGCTACVVLITKTQIYVANSGDSRCVLSKSGEAIPLSKDHKPELDLEKKRIEAAGGFIEDGRVNGVLNLSRTLGDLEYKQNSKLSPEKQIITAMPDIKVEKIGHDTEFLILACDGIWDCFSNQAAVNFFRAKIWDKVKNKPIKTKLSTIVSSALDSILAVDINNEGIIDLLYK